MNAQKSKNNHPNENKHYIEIYKSFKSFYNLYARNLMLKHFQTVDEEEVS